MLVQRWLLILRYLIALQLLRAVRITFLFIFWCLFGRPANDIAQLLLIIDACGISLWAVWLFDQYLEQQSV